MELTIEDIKNAIREEYMNSEEYKKCFPIHYTGINPDGTRYSYWDYGDIVTGDGGHELMVNAMKKEFENKFGNLK